MQMYHPDKYETHNRTLIKFCSAFNDAANKLEDLIHMKPSDVENYREDGQIVHKPTEKYLLFDFEKRDTYYDTCGFSFPDLGQFERKIQKPEISLSIQCSRDEECFCIAWHEDFKKEPVKHIGSKIASGNKEHTGKRFTKAFIELKYTEMNRFYSILLNAFTSNQFNANCFK